MRISPVGSSSTSACASCEPAPARAHVVDSAAQLLRHIVGRRRAAELDEQPVRRVPQREVGLVHARGQTATTLNGVSTASWRPGTQRLTRKTPLPT